MHQSCVTPTPPPPLWENTLIGWYVHHSDIVMDLQGFREGLAHLLPALRPLFYSRLKWCRKVFNIEGGGANPWYWSVYWGRDGMRRGNIKQAHQKKHLFCGLTCRTRGHSAFQTYWRGSSGSCCPHPLFLCLNFDWASEFWLYLPRILYTLYRENGELRSFLNDRN